MKYKVIEGGCVQRNYGYEPDDAAKDEYVFDDEHDAKEWFSTCAMRLREYFDTEYASRGLSMKNEGYFVELEAYETDENGEISWCDQIEWEQYTWDDYTMENDAYEETLANWFGEGWYRITDGTEYWNVGDKNWPTTGDEKWLPISAFDEEGVAGAMYYKWQSDLQDTAEMALRKQLVDVSYVENLELHIEFLGNGDEPEEQD